MDITFASYPTTIEDFLALRDQHATTPEGGAACYALALLMYSDSSLDQLVGLSAVIASTDLGHLSKSTDTKKSYKGYAIGNGDMYLVSKIRDNPSTARSYFVGTSPEAQYALPATLTVHADATSNPHNGNTAEQAKVFVTSSGADSARPIHLHKNDKGLWKANNWSSLLVGVKVIKKVVDDL
jgi:hypothetical protein